MSETLPATIAILPKEGGQWIAWTPQMRDSRQYTVVHAIMFADGCVWDAINGMRSSVHCPHCYHRLGLPRGNG